MFKLGSTGNEVKLIQSLLKSLGFKISSVDGEFGKETESAVIEYQRKRKLTDDGVVGPKTLELFKIDGFIFSEDRGPAIQAGLTKDFIGRIKYHAELYEGFIEIENNAAWDDPDQKGWQKEMSDTLFRYMIKIKPWSSGQPYCAASVGAFLMMALEDCGLSTDKLCKFWTAHVMTNVRYARSRNILSITPSLGSVWLAKFGETDQGHTGVVIDIHGDNLENIEGNTVPGVSKDPKQQRSGNGIFRRKFHKGGRGVLKTQGFISAENILKFFV
jgi:hypothetical protein